MSDALLRSVLDEIRTRIHFTEKTTDIYRIWQSGDLANLDGLDTTALEQLPALRQLRDAMYSREFRDYLSQVTGQFFVVCQVSSCCRDLTSTFRVWPSFRLAD